MEIWNPQPQHDVALWPPGGSAVIAYEDSALDALWKAVIPKPEALSSAIAALNPDAKPMLALYWLNLAKTCLLDGGDLAPPSGSEPVALERRQRQRELLDGLIVGVGATGDTPILTTADLLARLDSEDSTFDECMFHMAIRAKLIYTAVGGSSTLRTFTRALRYAVGPAARAAEVDTLAYLVLTRATNSGRQAVSLGATDELRAHAVLGACVELMTVVFVDPVPLCDVRAPDVKLVEAIGWDTRDIGSRLALVNTMLDARRRGRPEHGARAAAKLEGYGTRYYGVLLHLLCGVLADALQRSRRERGLPEIADSSADHRGRG
ncbi:MAG TPA: hypothetical protein VL551_10565 [Actinospica sp.]|jgi:hypothetical protein|nr:hypothetical protein [Actinospica sp.]